MQEIKERIQKLLALAGSSNENEAVAAMAKAQQLLTLYNLELADLGGDTSEVGLFEMDGSGKLVGWKAILLQGIEEANNCYFFTRRRANSLKYMFVGKEAAIAVSKEMYAYLVGVVDRLAKEAGGTRKFRNGFRVGCAKRLEERMTEAAKQDREQGIAASEDSPARSAIVVKSLYEKQKAEIEEYVEQNLQVKQSNSPFASTSSADGYNAGREAGDRVSLSKQIGGR